MPNYEYRPWNSHFPQAGPDTTNLRWGLERLLGLYDLASSYTMSRDAIVALEQYVQMVARLTAIGTVALLERTGDGVRKVDFDQMVEEAALEANVEFPEEERRQ